MSWRVLIVDDEQLAREELAFSLGQIPEFEIVGQAATGMEAIKKTKEMNLDFVFLDIQLGDLTGLQVAELIREFDMSVEIVFLTAYDQFAIEAFKLRAFHYILKPYDLEDLRQIVASYGQAIRRKNIQQSVDYQPRLAIDADGDIRYLSPKEIVYIAKEGRGVTVITTTDKYQANYTLQWLEEKLKPYSFFRTHKSYLVNLEHIRGLHPWFNGSYNLHMDDLKHSAIPVSRNYIKELRFMLEI